MARVARGAPVGQLIGPIPSHGGYSILRVTARREGETATFVEARPAVASDLRDRAMDAFIDSLRQVFADRIQVDEAALARTLGGMAP
jgi:parvulin-like peptidyl-prolyl isomerase